jgi:hypothetical protein
VSRLTILFLKITVILMGLPAIAVCVFSVISLFSETHDQFPGKMQVSDIGFFAAFIPYFIALYKGYQLIGYIDKKIAFSELSVRALKKIKYCGFSISLIFVAMEPVLYIMARQEDAPGVVVLGLIVIFASFVIAIFGALLERLLQNVINLKLENEHTV